MSSANIITIERFILAQERMYEGATGDLTSLLYDIALAGKIISSYVRRAGIVDVLGSAGNLNVQGEVQQKLDVIANDTIKQAVAHTGRVCVMASEEEDDPILCPGSGDARYVLMFDPLDGSSNIDVNASIGTIFSIHKRSEDLNADSLAQTLQRGTNQVAAGYIIYGSSTVMVYTTGQGVHVFTLDPTIGEFRLLNPDVRVKRTGKYYSVNESNFSRWTEGYREVVRHLKGAVGDPSEHKNARYIGSLVADFHRNLISGGVFIYPADSKSPEGKLRLQYEANPLAFVIEQAGGRASDGRRRIMEIDPQKLHQRTPLVIGSTDDVLFVEKTVAAVDGDG